MNSLRRVSTRSLVRWSALASNAARQSFRPKILNGSTSMLALRPSPLVINSRYITTEEAKQELDKRIEGCIAAGDVVVFMKGVPEAPRCGFSNAVCQILRMHDVTFKSYDVLADNDLRIGVKEYSKWPTYPQVFFKGELIGGCDILLQMHQSGDLIEELDKIGIKSALAEEEETKPSNK